MDETTSTETQHTICLIESMPLNFRIMILFIGIWPFIGRCQADIVYAVLGAKGINNGCFIASDAMGGIIHGIDQMWGLGQLKRNSVKSWQKLGQQQLNKKASPPQEKKNLIHKNLILTALFSLREHMNEIYYSLRLGKNHIILHSKCNVLHWHRFVVTWISRSIHP